VGSALLAAGTAFAGDTAHEQTFNELDENKDGVLTQAEASADSELIAQFTVVDTNQDGMINLSEYDQIRDEEEEAE
jgi:Ca2+-binding EF-hand superfamily protein